jgi:hypothetical protein
MGLLDGLLGLFGRKEEPPARATPPKGKPEERKKLARQVYPSTFSQVPEWAANLDQAHIIQACEEHAVCKFKPHIEVKKIMSARTGLDGNLETEYEGVAADCGAVKTFGKQVALHDGYLQPYRYVSLHHIYACCCDKPRKCTFFSVATGLDQELAKRQKRVGGG